MSISRLYKKAPYFYFVVVCAWIALSGTFNGHPESALILCISAAFLYPIFKFQKGYNLLLGIITFCWALLMLFAFLADASGISNFTSKEFSFLASGITIVFLNFLMSVKIILNSIDRNTLKTSNTASAV